MANLNDQDLATVLAALRFYQESGMGDPDNRSDMIHDIATNGDTVISMDADGIDDLCARLNTSTAPDTDATAMIKRLLEWASDTGGWEAPVWAEARRFVGYPEDDEQDMATEGET